MVRQMYAPLSFMNIEGLEEAIKETKLSPSYEMARLSIQKNTLNMTAIGKFHEIDSPLKHPSLNELAQMELIDVNPGNEVVDIYQHALQDQGHGRIAVVGSDGTTYDIAQQCGMLIALEKEVEKLQPLVYKLEEDNVTDSPHDLSLKLVTLQDSLHQLSDVRSINGFSAYENKIYGHAGLFCHTLSLSIQNYRKRTEQEYDLGEFEPLVELYRMIQESNVAEMEKEYMSPTGINLPFYFNPRLKPEDVKHAIHKHH